MPCDDDCCCCCFSVFSLSRQVATCLKYVFILLLTWVICLLLLLPHVRAKVVANHGLYTNIISRATVQNFFGFTAVYRVCFSIGACHLLMSVCLINASSDNGGTRTLVHHGLWPVKCLVLLGSAAGMFFVSSSSWLFTVLMYMAMACGFMFSLVEVLLLVDVAHQWHASWVAKPDDNASKKCWSVMLLFSTLAMYLAAIICIAILYAMFAASTKCKTNKFFMIFIVCHCIVACILSMLPVIQRAQSNAGSLQSAIVTLYAVLLTWTAVTHQPYNGCSKHEQSSPLVDTGLSVQAVINTFVVLMLLLYASISSSQSRLKLRIWPAITEVKKDEDTYSYSLFHLVMFLSSFHIMISLTNWSSPEGRHFQPSWSGVWVKMAACSVCMWVYLWTLVSPLFRSEDDNFEENPPKIVTIKNNPLYSSPQKDLNSHEQCKETPRPASIFTRDKDCQSPFVATDINDPVRVTHGSMSRKGSPHTATPEAHAEKEMIRLHGKVMRLQEKIAKLQTKVASLQGLHL